MKQYSNSHSFQALSLSSLKGYSLIAYISSRKLVCTFQHITIRKRKDCRSANAFSIPREFGIEHPVQVMLAESDLCNSAEARKAEKNASEE